MKNDWDYGEQGQAMSQGNTGKVYFLSERGRRSMPRAVRKRPESSPASPTERRKPSSEETTWLSRALFIEGLYFALLWIAAGTDLFWFEANAGMQHWIHSFFPAEIFIAVMAFVGAYELQRHAGKRDAFSLVAAGGLIFIALERMTLLITGGFHHDLTPSERLQVTAMGICLAIGIWAVSHSLRFRAER